MADFVTSLQKETKMTKEAELRKKALAGNTEAQRELGNRYREFNFMIPPAEGEDRFEPTLREAVRFLTMAAEQGMEDAQVDLANMLSLELPSQANYVEALKWYERAARKGNLSAMIRLGMMAEQGQGQPRDYGLAAKFYRRAADKGHPLGMFNLALLYRSGRGVETSQEKAIKWFRKASDKGDSYAPYYIGEMLEFNQPDEARAWYDIAANRGLLEAELKIGQLLHRQGHNEEALPHLRRAVKLGGAGARQALMTLEEMGFGQ